MNRRELLVKALRTSTALVCIPPIRLEAAALLQQESEGKATNHSPSAKVTSRPQLVAHWKLNGDYQDGSGSNHGAARRIEFVEGIDGRAGGAALFNGIDSMIEVR